MLEALSASLAASRASLIVQERLWVVPAVQSIHILAIGLLLFSALSADVIVLRGHDRRQAIPWLPSAFHWTWGMLVVLLCSGAILIVGEPARSLLNWVFRLKMMLVLAATGVTLILQRLLVRGGAEGSRTLRLSLAGVSVALWLTIILCGRMIAYFGNLHV